MPCVRIVCGPTAAGKSAIALELAATHNLTIISADSRQLYRGFDIGTAKPSRAEQESVPHWGVDIADPMERWSAARWAAHAADVIARTGADRVLVVGGTGLYLNALISPLFDEPPTDPIRRAALVHELDAWPLAKLRDWARRLDPARAHLGRTQLMRSVEVALLSGERLSTLHKESGTAVRFRARWLVVDPGAPLQEQIACRVASMLAAGWIDEARDLATHVDPDAPAWQACGYAAIRAVARGEQALQDVQPGILVHTRQYAKRQRTWFRHQLAGADVTRLDPRERGAAGTVDAWWGAQESP